jgi:hypothetical protein
VGSREEGINFISGLTATAACIYFRKGKGRLPLARRTSRQINAEILVSRESTSSRSQPHPIHPPYIYLLLYQFGQEITKSRLRILEMTDPASPNPGTRTRTSKRPSSLAVMEGRRALRCLKGRLGGRRESGALGWVLSGEVEEGVLVY